MINPTNLDVLNIFSYINGHLGDNGTYRHIHVYTHIMYILILINYCSFIQRPFKEVYSGALPTQPRSNNVVLRLERKGTEWTTGVRRSTTGRPFPVVGPATA